MSYLLLATENDEEADAFFRTTLLPLFSRLPGLQRLESARVLEKPFGSISVRSIVDIYFQSEDEMHRAMTSAEGKAIARELMANPHLPVELLLLQQDT